MPIVIPTFSRYPQFSHAIALAGRRYRLRFTWRDRTGSWYMDLMNIDGTLVRGGGRLSPGFTPFMGIRSDDYPEGEFAVIGPDDYEKEDLGRSLLVLFYTDEELEAVIEGEGS